MSAPIKSSGGLGRVTDWLAARGHPSAPVLLNDAARTAQQAADALGVALGQIAKSIIFRRLPDDRAVLVIASGDRRVDEQAVHALVCGEGQSLGRADAKFVKAQTGFSIGGVAPVALAQPAVTLIESGLRRFPTIWAAAGHPHGVFELTPQQLLDYTGAPVHDVAQAMEAAPEPRSPCTSVCRMNPVSGLCEGCWRTLDEIAAWGAASADEKRATLQRVRSRMATS